MLAHAHPDGGRAQPRPRLEVADIVRAHGEAFARTHALTPEQHAVLRDIARCRTAELGGHIDVCTACGHVEGQSYNSCRNRHCPKCQSLEQFHWVSERMKRMGVDLALTLLVGEIRAWPLCPRKLEGSPVVVPACLRRRLDGVVNEGRIGVIDHFVGSK